ncbi:DUF6597 domain-containing protein [Erysipelothrix urinaevulpis]|uniref:DUF6597 domain-containing transcriptional factor n=1 Tax=Erysipelothrix urinaevulpis TaxID=2683717 RepID=UPI0013585CF6|nr:DUF6597 domain-containing transcriptional factor [Erysipelothrix urinaevulpis]
MYKVVQIPQTLDKEFNTEVMYKEVVRTGINPEICLWYMTKESTKDIYNSILTDACIDIIFDLKERTIFIGATKTSTVKLKSSDPFDFMGIRLRPGVAYHIFPKIKMSDCFTNRQFTNENTPELKSLMKIFDLKDRNAKQELIYEFLDHYTPVIDNDWVNIID